MATRLEKIEAVKSELAAKLGDILERTYDNAGTTNEADAIRVLLDQHRACEIAYAEEIEAEKKRRRGNYLRALNPEGDRQR